MPSNDDPIEVSPGKHGGNPVFRGTRIPISFLAPGREVSVSPSQVCESQ
ncbi:DUF433 domain-containing protein [Salinibacter ruber]